MTGEPKWLDEAVAAYQAGERLVPLSKRLRTWPGDLSLWLRSRGVKIRPKGPVPGSGPVRSSETVRQKVRAAYEAGMGIKAAARHVGISHVIAERILHDLGVKMRPAGNGFIPPPPPPPVWLEAAIADYQAGMSLRQIQTKLGAPKSTLLAWLRRRGVPIRGRGRSATSP